MRPEGAISGEKYQTPGGFNHVTAQERQVNILRVKWSGRASRNNERRSSPPRQQAYRRKIHVVIVIVADQHGIYRWQILKKYSRLSSAPRTYPRKRTGPLGPDGIGQNVGAALLKEDGRMIHQRHSQSISIHS